MVLAVQVLATTLHAVLHLLVIAVKLLMDYADVTQAVTSLMTAVGMSTVLQVCSASHTKGITHTVFTENNNLFGRRLDLET